MIDLGALNPQTLPSVPLKNRSKLPAEPCIYFAIDSQDVIQYIGRTTNAKARWNSHHRRNDLELIGGIRIAYLMLDEFLLSEVERALINWFDPPLNVKDSPSFVSRPKPFFVKKAKSKATEYLPGDTPMMQMLVPKAWHGTVKALAQEKGMSMAAYLDLLAEKKDEIAQLV
jgi:hypothetical protein